MRKVPWAIMLLLGLLFTAACSDGGTGPDPEPTITGVYNLKTVNGQNLPFTIPDTNGEVKLTGQTLELLETASGQTFILKTKTQVQSNPEVTNQKSGSWVNNGGQLSLSISGEGTYTASLSGKKITLIEDGLTFVLEK